MNTAQFKGVALVALDVDGVLTDGRLYYGESGEALKAFNVKDGSAIKRLMKAGIPVALITARTSSYVAQRAQDLGIPYCFQGVENKLAKLKELQAELGIAMAQTCYVGDDHLDLACLQAVGVSVMPRDGVAALRAAVTYVAETPGGGGIVSEIAALILTPEVFAGRAPAVHVVIPARYDSSRFPGKPLVLLQGKPMIQWVYERAKPERFSSVIIATDDRRIADACRGFGAEWVMTAREHPSGTDRLAEVARVKGWGPHEIVVNLQGDEPLLPEVWLTQVVELLVKQPDASLATLAARCRSVDEARDPHVVKVVLSQTGQALYFSRSLIPFQRDAADRPPNYWRHIGLYAYRVGDLARLSAAAPVELELSEKLEQLRALALGMRIAVGVTPETALGHPGGVDTPEDLARLEAWLKTHSTQS